MKPARAEKIVPAERLGALRVAVTKRLVFCSGCFDVLHAGHAVFIDQCRAFGDVLVAGVGRDSYIRRMKGPTRPINPESNRLYLIAALAAVDYVVLTNDPPAGETDITGILRQLQPDVLALTESDTEAIELEARTCRELGIRLEIVPRVVPAGLTLTSTTKILGQSA